MQSQFLGDTEGDMEWLHDVHGIPSDMKCAILRGNVDSPERIEAWRIFNPPHNTPPDFVYISPNPNPYYSDAEGKPLSR